MDKYVYIGSASEDETRTSINSDHSPRQGIAGGGLRPNAA
jgi:hypothetical protein